MEDILEWIIVCMTPIRVEFGGSLASRAKFVNSEWLTTSMPSVNGDLRSRGVLCFQNVDVSAFKSNRQVRMPMRP